MTKATPLYANSEVIMKIRNYRKQLKASISYSNSQQLIYIETSLSA